MTADAPRTPLHAFAWATRRFHPKGTDRLLRLVHPPGNANPVRTVVDYDDGLLMNIDTHSFCEWYIWFYGVFRPEIARLLNRMLRPGQVAIDIGANIGMHSVVMANRVGPTGQVHSFEPDPHPLGRLRANLALNGFDWAQTHALAVSDKTEKRTFYLHDESIGNFANASLNPANVGRDTPRMEMDVVAIDDFMARHAVPRLDAIKVLAQGEEFNVFKGAEQSFKRFRPKVFFLYEPSYWARQGLKLLDAKQFFASLGYTSTLAVEFGPRREVTGEIDKGQVFLAVP